MPRRARAPPMRCGGFRLPEAAGPGQTHERALKRHQPEGRGSRRLTGSSPARLDCNQVMNGGATLPARPGRRAQSRRVRTARARRMAAERLTTQRAQQIARPNVDGQRHSPSESNISAFWPSMKARSRASSSTMIKATWKRRMPGLCARRAERQGLATPFTSLGASEKICGM
jgi:hypothetical protein